MARNREGFTLIELLLVVVIVGILAAIALPKFMATTDKAKLAGLRSDLHVVEVAQLAYFSDFETYATLAQLRTAKLFQLSSGNTMAIARTATGYTVTATNSSIASAIKKCTVRVGAGAPITVDGKITCP